jgi:hypothetical protein
MGPEQYSIAKPPHLYDDRRWFVTGLCYSYAKFPTSLIQMLRPREHELVDVETFLVDKPVYIPANFQIPLDNWQKTVQGLELSYTMNMMHALENAQFNIGDASWRIRVQEVDVGDPFSPLRTVKLFYLLPCTADRRLTITKTIHGMTAVIERQANGR